jgi:DNA-binding NtrC family response regulator
MLVWSIERLVPFVPEMSEPRSILVVDDDVAVGKVLFALLKQAGYRVRHVTSGHAALVAIGEASYDAVISDLRMPGMDGMALLAALKEHDPALPVVMLTAHGTITLAVEAMRLGAQDFLEKPPDREALLYVMDKVTRVAAAALDAPPERKQSKGIIGSSPTLTRCLSLVDKAAKTSATVLIRGESGTGKELVARAIHDQSARRDGPFIAVHCAALPENLLESELFGYVKGAFTGAASDKPGRVEVADQGTLFFDEIGDVPPSIQVKLLRLVNEKEYTPVGGTRVHKADVRFVTATHRDLEAMVEDGRFREDLFYRLNVVPVTLPPLRERGDDITVLARHFLSELGPANGHPGLSFTDDALVALRAHAFPGNVRELANMIERLVIFCDGDAITQTDVDRELSSRARPPNAAASSSDSLADDIKATKKSAVEDALVRAHENRTKAARILGISRRTLYNWMEELGIA